MVAVIVEMNEDPQDRPSFLTMIGVVAIAVAVIILLFFGIGYGFGRLFL